MTSPWLRSSFCEESGCLLVAFDGDSMLLGKTKPGPEHGVSVRAVLTIDEWSSFVAGVLAGEFQRPMAVEA